MLCGYGDFPSVTAAGQTLKVEEEIACYSKGRRFAVPRT